ncbi:CpsD/CapB family tyrosine-protein kinase [candidate division KSB1 bacterium]|nr:CpsD/CapB family tyrosine-protein kinase [candidate division KSB1 bacterium]NIR68863.1 CpsD/CapB family tyrosine-protein kinase [candidate division KSB1 bacterium]NIS27231.1 CpsD/CapB family tyrosine-protein kinase [candidate division KSB1 bacterium]NIT74116.1 CpsD/CapB family tyrosine-protein kinase [candidate division KSB1 bacterium]NIU27965.1 CpsD/CapB family tyrosine-protein kinase [candidate division KSB1 bacterium]
MDFIHEVLKKAEQEGKIDSNLVPWKSANRGNDANKEQNTDRGSAASFITFPDEILDEVQIILDNIRSVAKKQALRIIGVTSPDSKAGTSTLATMISLIMARNQNPGSETLLIDAQLRNPTLHEFFRLSLSPGLFDYLQDQISHDSIINDFDQFNLNVITAGQAHKDFAVQLISEKLNNLLQKLKQKFECIFLDIPPVLRFAEGLSLSKLCDGLILVVRSGHTRGEAVEETKRLLKTAEVNVLGGILNRREFFIPEKLYRFL